MRLVLLHINKKMEVASPSSLREYMLHAICFNMLYAMLYAIYCILDTIYCYFHTFEGDGDGTSTLLKIWECYLRSVKEDVDSTHPSLKENGDGIPTLLRNWG